MAEIEDGGPAFPRPGMGHPDTGMVDYPEIGMTLRQWYSGQATAGLVQVDGYGDNHWPRNIAKDALAVADALIAEERHGQEAQQMRDQAVHTALKELVERIEREDVFDEASPGWLELTNARAALEDA